MAFLFDNLAATIVGATIMLILFTVQKRAVEVNVERTAVYAAKKRALSMGKWMQLDLANLGAGLNGNESGIVSNESDGDNTTEFVYRYRNTAGDEVHVSYALEEVDSVAYDDATMTLYRLRRYEQVGSGPPQERGGSTPTLTQFHIEQLDETGDVTGAISQTRFLRVRFSVSVPFHSDRQYLRETHWGAVLPVRN